MLCLSGFELYFRWVPLMRGFCWSFKDIYTLQKAKKDCLRGGFYGNFPMRSHISLILYSVTPKS